MDSTLLVWWASTLRIWYPSTAKTALGELVLDQDDIVTQGNG